MLHSIGIDRLFTLGDYKNVHISVKTEGITDEEWNDQARMDAIRSDVSMEVLMNFALLQHVTSTNSEIIANRDWLQVYTDLIAQRHISTDTNTDVELVSEL